MTVTACMVAWGSNANQATNGFTESWDWSAINIQKTSSDATKAGLFAGAMCIPGVGELALGGTMLYAGSVSMGLESADQLIASRGQSADMKSIYTTGAISAATAGVFKCISKINFQKTLKGSVNFSSGRTGKQARLKQLANDDKVSSALRGEIKRDMNMIARGQRTTIRVPQGYNLSHRIGTPAAKGYNYMYSDLLPIDMHKQHHKIFGYKR